MSEGLLKPGCCPRRRWGKSGLDIPVIPFGTQGFGDHFGPVSDEQAMALIRRAVDLGVNHEAGEIDVLLTFNDYNLFGQTAADDILPAAAAKDIGVLNGWSIKRGLLTGTPVEKIVARDRWIPGSEPERAERMRLWCAERGIGLLNLALQFCLRERRIHGNPLGNLNVEQLEMNVAAVLTPLPERMFEDFRAAEI